ncbi:MAG: CBS domain-containing protein [Candidatus Melainabacteria bacterium]|nr:CBS domain-containing protein [Candidatus Melainabacteria bacterium]
MELVFAHNNMDFDSLSAQFALTKLYPSCKMVLGYPLTGNLRSFITLNRGYLPIVEVKYVDLSKVTRFFLVDCQHFERLDSGVRKLMEETIDSEPGVIHLCRPLTIFDHHERDSKSLISLASEDSQVEVVGAATTILVEQIRKKKIALSPFDATVLAIGIFEDTGCLTYAGTTPRDAECIAFLIQHGADLSVVREYIRPKIEQEQVALLEELLRAAQLVDVQGHKFVVATAHVPKYIEELASLTRQLLDLEAVDGAFTVVHMKDRVHIVGRADPRIMSVKPVVQAFGGDGHPGAGSAVVKGGNVREIAERIKTILQEQTPPQPLARDLMVSPVRTIKSSVSMDEAGRMMLRYGLDGLLVTEGEELVGVVSRRDIDQSSHHKLGHAKVSGFMSKPVICVSEDTPLSKIQELMVAEDIGRLPVLDQNKKLIGLVSRRDVLNRLFGSQYARQEDTTAQQGSSAAAANLSGKLAEVDSDTAWLCRTIGETAQELGMSAYAVGGFVRDLLLNVPNFDLDYVIEGSAQKLADRLLELYPNKLTLAATHDRFQTATLICRLENDGAGAAVCGEQQAERGGAQQAEREVDLSTARTEFYEFPAALPEVEASKLEQDLLRRDFTINALAVCVNPDRFGNLTDHFNGLHDLEHKIVRILHPFSFIEDPTRMVRAARFAGRLGFHLDAKTKEQARRASQLGIFDDLGGVRIKAELKMILESPHRLRALNLLAEQSGNLCYLDSRLDYGDGVRKTIRRAERLLGRYSVDEPWVVYLGALLSELPPERVSGVLERLMLTNHQKEVIESGLELHRYMPLSMSEMKRSELYEMMHGRPREALAIAAAAGQIGTDLRRSIKLYLEELADTKLDITGADLIATGIKPGPRIGEALKHVLAERLDGQVSGREQELQVALSYIK